MSGAAARDILRSLAREAFARPPALPPDEWADKYRIVIPGASSEPGPWRTTAAPYARDILRSLADPAVRRVSLMAPTQVVKTEIAINFLCWIIDQAPGPAMLVFPDRAAGRKFIADRLIPTFQATPAVARHMSVSSRDTQSTLIRFDRMTLYLASAASVSSIASTPVRYLVLDELDMMDEAAVRAAESRVKTYRDHKILYLSSPDAGPGRGIDAEYHRGDQRKYYLPCPDCGVWTVPDFDHLRWSADDAEHPERLRRSVVLACPACGGAHDEGQRMGMVRRAAWALLGTRPITPIIHDATVAQRLARGPAIDGQPERPGSDHHSYNLSGLCSTRQPMCAVAQRYIEHGWTADFASRTLGRPWVEKSNVVHGRELAEACRPLQTGGYEIGTVPAGVLALVAGVDVQDDHVWVGVVGFGRAGAAAALIWYCRIDAPPATSLIEISDLPRWSFPRGPGAAAAGEPELMPVRAVAIDAAYGKRAEEVYRRVLAWRAAGHPYTFAVRGQPNMSRMEPVLLTRLTARADRRASTIYEGMDMLLINKPHWAPELYRRYRTEIAAAQGQALDVNAPRLLLPAAPHVEPPASASGPSTPRLADFIAQATAEHLVFPSAKKGRPISDKAKAPRWELRPGVRDNHAFDILQYIFGLAHHMQVVRLGAADDPAARPAAPPRREDADGSPAHPASARTPSRRGPWGVHAGGGARGGPSWADGIRERWQRMRGDR